MTPSKILHAVEELSIWILTNSHKNNFILNQTKIPPDYKASTVARYGGILFVDKTGDEKQFYICL